MSSDLAQAIHDPLRIRSAGADLLSLALIDSRNHLLRWLAAFEPHLGKLKAHADVEPPLWLVGHAAWFQEYWVARNVQRQRGESVVTAAMRLPSLERAADGLFDPGLHHRAQRWALTLPAPAGLRAYLGDTLEATLDVLAGAARDDDALFVYRAALRHEDMICEALAAAAQALQLNLPDAPWGQRTARAQREPLWFAAQHFALGSVPGGLVPANERWAHEVAVPEFEIDAQAVSWARYTEFVADGGYDDPRLWGEAGWQWLQQTERRAPRYVEQMRDAVLAQRNGQMQRLPMTQAVAHASRFEAEAWCRWAGRRLPTEVEWEIAACGGRSRGFAYGDVFEWVAGSARPYPAAARRSTSYGHWPEPRSQGVLRGGSWMTRSRWLHPKARRFAAPQRDESFCGFRSCAL